MDPKGPSKDDGARALAKRRHDLKAAARTLTMFVQAIEGGYKFDDDKARAKVEAVAKAVQVLTRESEQALAALESADPQSAP